MSEPEKPDLKKGILLSGFPEDGKLVGTVDGEEVLLIRRTAEFFAVGAHCTHYQGPLAEGLITGDEVRCPWHHARFNLRTGEAVCAPALDPIACWQVDVTGDTVFVTKKVDATGSKKAPTRTHPSAIVIVGGGAAGLAAAEMLRREGYSGSLTMVSADADPPCDRPNLSKDFLAGTTPEDWIPLRPREWYSERQINLVLNSRVTSLDTKRKTITTDDGKTFPYEALLIATGADPVKLPIAGASLSQLSYLRSLADSRALVSKASPEKRALIVGASFIGLEVAASLRTRGLAVQVVAPGRVPMEKVLGMEVGTFIRRLHESKGVVFHLGENVKSVDGNKVLLSGGAAIEADIIVVGVGVEPSVRLAEQAGLKMDRGILVNEYLETSEAGVFAAGDAARWPDSLSGERIRVEHWVVAERQGQTAAKNMLGARERFETVPFFWSQHYDVPINYVGHAENWDAIEIDGNIEKRDCLIRYKRNGRTLAVATIFRDLESLEAEVQMEARNR
jgi:apoptosis-inducing factor 3